MFLEHCGERPRIHESAYVAPTATVSGNVSVGRNSRVLFGTVLTAEGGPVEIGAECVVMENAVVRGTPKHPARIGDHVLIGPRAYLSGCTVQDNAFLATGATVFNGAVIGEGASLAVNEIGHIEAILPAGARVPIGWIAVGDPVEIISPQEDEKRRELMEPQDFYRTVFGADRESVGQMMPEIMRRYTRSLGSHRMDCTLDIEQIADGD
jgi:carbonic anhydrase/acetyltransferase-like protein (isoleucine patch superfamily)